MSIRFATVASAGLIVIAAGRLGAFPEPALVNPSWQFDITCKLPRTIGVEGLNGRTSWYWYLPFKIVNRSKSEQLFVPETTIATDQGDIITAGKGVPPDVFPAIKQLLGNPLLEHPLQVSGRILIGEDHAKESVAIWPVFASDVDEMSVFITGLSGETQTIKHPVSGEVIPLRKTLRLVYQTPGTGTDPQRQPIVIRTQDWVMR